MDVKEGAGTAVQDSIINAACKYLGELPAQSMLDTSSVDTIDPFTRSGLTPDQLRDFFSKAAKAGRKTTPTTESGNVYAVSKTFHALNGPLVVDEYLNKLHSLDASDLQRARAFVETVALDAELRNRNPLHPSATDALVIGTLLDFPKSLFGFPYACYATDGRESLSLCLYSYRLRTGKRRVVGDANDATLKGVALRLGMTVCSDMAGAACVVVTLASITWPLCAEAALRGVPVHVLTGVRAFPSTTARWREEWTSSNLTAIPRHRRDVVPVAASVRWRFGSRRLTPRQTRRRPARERAPHATDATLAGPLHGQGPETTIEKTPLPRPLPIRC